MANFTRTKRAVLAVAVVVGLLAAAWHFVPPWFGRQFELRPGLMTLQPKLLPKGIPGSLPDLLRGQIEVEATIFVRNKTWLNVTLRDVKWRVFVKNRRVARGTLPGEQLLPSDREQPLKMQALISAPALGLATIDVLRMRSADIVVEVDATASVLGLTLSQKMRLTGFDLRLDSTPTETK